MLRALQARDRQLAESLMRAYIGRANEGLVKAHSCRRQHGVIVCWQSSTWNLC